MSAIENAVQEAAEGLTRAIAGNLGVSLNPEQVVAVAAEGARMLAGLVSARQWQEAHARGAEAASHINTLEDAEAAAKGRK